MTPGDRDQPHTLGRLLAAALLACVAGAVHAAQVDSVAAPVARTPARPAAAAGTVSAVSDSPSQVAAEPAAVTAAAVAPAATAKTDSAKSRAPDSAAAAAIDTVDTSAADTGLSAIGYSPLVDTGSFFGEASDSGRGQAGPAVVPFRRAEEPSLLAAWYRRAAWVSRHVGGLVPSRRFVGYLLQLLVLAVSAGVIWYSLGYYFSRRDRERFLSSDRLSLMDKEVQKACLLVEESYADLLLSPQSLCEKLVTGESFLEVLFERELGMSVWDYIEHVRVNRAIQELRKEQQLADLEVATATGFSSAEELDRSFRKVTEMPVQAYREALAAGKDPLS